MKKILLVGGGSGGHILPLKSLCDELLKQNNEVHLLVSESLLDRQIVEENFKKSPTQKNKIYFHYLKTGKFRRYFSFKNITDFFKIIKAVFLARKMLKKIKPEVIFFKGGFVCFPILIATKYLGRFKGKIYLHNSDFIISRLSTLISKHAEKVFSNFGNPSFPLFFSETRRNDHSEKKINFPQILIFGGSQGAQFINELIFKLNVPLLKKYKITLVTGIDKKITLIHPNFEQFQLLPNTKLLQKIYESDLVITRGGASIFQVLEAQTPYILLTHPSDTLNHQMKNAQYFETKNLVKILEQNKFTKKHLLSLIETTIQDLKLKKSLAKSNIQNKTKEIAKRILK